MADDLEINFDPSVNQAVERLVRLKESIKFLTKSSKFFVGDFKESLIVNLQEEEKFIMKFLRDTYDNIPTEDITEEVIIEESL